jgi:hypothetical protein
MQHHLEWLTKNDREHLCVTSEWFLPRHPTHTILFHRVLECSGVEEEHPVGEEVFRFRDTNTYECGPITYTVDPESFHAERRWVPYDFRYRTEDWIYQDGRWVPFKKS